MTDHPEFFRIMDSTDYKTGRSRTGGKVPWALMAEHEAQAKRNHGQTLVRLNERGGLSWCEAAAVLLDRPWRELPHEEAKAIVMRCVADAEPNVLTTDEVAALHRRQFGPWATQDVGGFSVQARPHAYTCPNRGDGKHFDNGSDLGALIPTTRGWICQCCSYTQKPTMASAGAKETSHG
jgi:hypothetical protein